MSKKKVLIAFGGLLVILAGFLFSLNLSSKESRDTDEISGSQPEVTGALSAIQNPDSDEFEQSGDESADETQPEFDQAETVKVIRVVDGDTIEIEGGKRVRYIGIDTPESTTQLECFGKESAHKNKELISGKRVKLEKDVSETDKYGRLLRYVYVGDIFVNEFLVKEGFAHASSYPPDIKYQNQFRAAQQEAARENRGLWSACSSATQYNKEGCQIKGNISSSGEKIYHLPGQKYYNQTVISEDKGERWFCTEEEAISAGWRKSKT